MMHNSESWLWGPASSKHFVLVYFICSANTIRDSIFTSSHCRSSHFLPLPRCQRYALAPCPALLSFAWLLFNPPTRFNRPLRMRSMRRKEPWRERRQSDLHFAPSKAAWKQPESNLHATVYQSTSLSHYGSRVAPEDFPSSPCPCCFGFHFLTGNWKKS